MDCVVVWFCFNSSVNFVKHFCWLVIINKGCETNRKNVAEAAWKEKCKFGWKLSGPQRKQKAQATCLRDFKKATVTELKGEKDRIRCLFWILARKLSNGAACVCNLGGWGGGGVGGRRRSFLWDELNYYLGRPYFSWVRLLGHQRRTCVRVELSCKVIKSAKHFKVAVGSLLCGNPLITDDSLCSDKQLNILIFNE